MMPMLAEFTSIQIEMSDEAVTALASTDERRARNTMIIVRAVMAACLICAPAAAEGQSEPSPAPAHINTQHDGSRDFDWEIGHWTTELRFLPAPLTGSKRWLEYRGTSHVHAILGGRANLVELSVAGSEGRIEGASLRLYNPQTRQWTLNFANIRNGQLTAPVHGAFDANGRGLFYGDRHARRPRRAGALRDFGSNTQLRAVRAGLLVRCRRNLGGQLDRGRHPAVTSAQELRSQRGPRSLADRHVDPTNKPSGHSSPLEDPHHVFQKSAGKNSRSRRGLCWASVH